jgi:uncharacterized protein YprB with RNaseH-like and TPR domain
MLEHSFIHLSDHGPAKERKLWEQGIRTWDKYLDNFSSCHLYRYHCKKIARSKHALRNNDPEFFAHSLASRECWRAFPHFEKIAYLDIETTGLGKGRDYTTVVGIFNGSKTKTFIHGENLDDLHAELGKYEMVVTFNGAQFDIPFLKNDLTGIKIPKLHVDLRWVLASLDVTGGLKRIEEKFGFEREDDLKGLNGYDAVKLWQRYKKNNDKDALDVLVRYNAADISNLEKLMKWAYKEKRKETGFDRYEC